MRCWTSWISPTTLPGLVSLLRPGGLCYFTIAFDGATILQPVIDPVLDVQIETLYHQTMDLRRIAGQRSGDSCTGRHLFGHLRAAGVEILDAGSSDWVIFAGPQGYPSDEAYFCTSLSTPSALLCKVIQGSIPSALLPGSPSAMPRSRRLTGVHCASAGLPRTRAGDAGSEDEPRSA